MNKKIAVWVLVIFLLATAVLAITKSYETSSVSRIIGNSPQDLTEQLQGENINLKHSTFVFGNEDTYSAYNVLEKIFGPEYSSSSELNHIGGDPEIEDVILNSDDYDKFRKNELIVFGGQGNLSSNGDKIQVEYNRRELDVDALAEEAKDYNPLIVFDSNFAGINIPNSQNPSNYFNPITPLFKDSTVIAPSLFHSNEFVRAFVCNLKQNGRSVGETFRQARNNYHWHTAAKDETIGVTLLSYHLFGNPTNNLTIPDYYQSSGLDYYCEDYWEEFDRSNNLLFSIMGLINESPEQEAYTGKFIYKISDYQISENDNFSILTTNTINQNYLNYELVLPKETIASPYPIQTIFMNVTLISLEDPVEITIFNLPSWDGSNFIERVCYQDQQNASVNFAHSFTEDREAVLIEINPVEVINCTDGKLRLYRTIKYNIDYLPFSPVLIEQISHLTNVGPNESTEIEVTLKNIKSHAVQGKLIIKDDKNNSLVHKNTYVHTASTTSFKIEFQAPAEEGLKEFTVEYYENEDKKTQSKFYLIVSQFNALVDAPLIISPNEELPVEITLKNNGDKQTVDYTLTVQNQDGQVRNFSDSLEADEGENKIQHTFGTQNIFPGFYTLSAVFSYHNPFDNAVETLTREKIFLIASDTPTAPHLAAPADVTIKEGERVVIQPEVYDVNGDPVTLTFGPPAGSNGLFQTNEDDQGTYTIKINASDGESTVSDSFTVTVEDNSLNAEMSAFNKNNVSFLPQGGRNTIFLKVLKKANIKSASMIVSGSSGMVPDE